MSGVANITRSFMIPDQPDPQAVRGGLSTGPMGGIAKFLQNAERGLQVVLSSPGYARIWSGAVSGIANDPMAGPVALESLRNAEAARIAAQKSPIQIENEELADRARNQRLEIDQRLRSLRPGSDEWKEAYAQRYPEQYGESVFGRPASVSPKAVLDKATGKPIYVRPEDAIGMEPIPRSPLVQIGADGLNPYQTAQTRKSYIDAHRDESRPYVETAGRLRELEGILAGLDGEPTPFQSEAAATAFAKGLKPAEAVMRDDIARILGQGWENQLKGFLNLPQKASRAQVEQMRHALAQIVAVAEMRQRGIDEKYQALGSDYQVEIPTYVSGSQSAQPPPAPTVPTPDAAEPRDAAYFESLTPGSIVRNPDGSRWRKMSDGLFEEVK